EGGWRLIQRIWRIIAHVADLAPDPAAPRPAAFGPDAETLRRTTHRALDAVSTDIEQLRFNRAIAHIYEAVNALNAALQSLGEARPSADLAWALREAAETVVRIAAPMVPHLAEESWRALGHDALLATSSWPEVERGLLVDD